MSETEKDGQYGAANLQDQELSSSGPGSEDEKVVAPAAPSAGGPPPVKPVYPQGIILSLILVSLMLSMFLVALDMSIIATAIPRITEQFHSLDQVGWYGSAFFLTLGAFVSFWGKAYKYLNIKWAFLTSIFVFEIGSLICAVAPNSTALIVGRAIQGAGGAGVTGGVYTILAITVPPPKVPMYMGLVGAVFSLASVAGPLLGGVLTQRITWRWCFYINLPIGGAAFGTLLIFFTPPAHIKSAPISMKELLLTFDLPGMFVLIGALTCYFLALEWGGITKAWSSSQVIGTLVGSILLTILFGVIEWKQGERALVVPRILKRRNIAVVSAFIFCTNISGFARVYNLPIYFQAIDGVSPSESGIRVLPTILSISLFTFVGAGAVGKLGWYQPFLIIGGMFATIGGGLIYTFDIGTPASKFIGYQFVAGMGLGLAIQVPIVVAQTTSSFKDLSVAMSTVLFFQFVAGALGVATAQSMFDNRMIESLPRYAPNVTAARVLAVGASDLNRSFQGAELLGVKQAYLVGLRAAWALSIALSGCTFVIAFLGEWKNFKPAGPPGGGPPGGAPKAEAEKTNAEAGASVPPAKVGDAA